MRSCSGRRTRTAGASVRSHAIFITRRERAREKMTNSCPIPLPARRRSSSRGNAAPGFIPVVIFMIGRDSSTYNQIEMFSQAACLQSYRRRVDTAYLRAERLYLFTYLSRYRIMEMQTRGLFVGDRKVNDRLHFNYV